MAWINTVRHDESEDDLRMIYDEIVRKRGKLSNIMRIQSLNPRVMQSHMAMYLDIMFGKSDIRRADRELVATVVSIANNCAYCTSHHAEALRHYWKDDKRLSLVVKGDYDGANLSPRQRAMIDYALVLTRSPGDMQSDDLAELRTAGLSDKTILDLNLIVSYFNFVNRIAQGLGVSFDENEVGGYNY